MTDEPENDDTNVNEEAADQQASSGIASLTEQLDATRAERDENYSLALRTQAELENYRRRVNREREEDARFRVLPLAKDLLPAIDNLRRAIQAASASGNADDLIRGVELVLKQLDDALAANSVKPIPTEGESFDANKHDALTQVPTTEHKPMTILQEVERGYTLHDRVLRPSKVIVATAPSEQS
jgi:molecular chaperone GrpE